MNTQNIDLELPKRSETGCSEVSEHKIDVKVNEDKPEKKEEFNDKEPGRELTAVEKIRYSKWINSIEPLLDLLNLAEQLTAIFVLTTSSRQIPFFVFFGLGLYSAFFAFSPPKIKYSFRILGEIGQLLAYILFSKSNDINMKSIIPLTVFTAVEVLGDFFLLAVFWGSTKVHKRVNFKTFRNVFIYLAANSFSILFLFTSPYSTYSSEWYSIILTLYIYFSTDLSMFSKKHHHFRTLYQNFYIKPVAVISFICSIIFVVVFTFVTMVIAILSLKEGKISTNYDHGLYIFAIIICSLGMVAGVILFTYLITKKLTGKPLKFQLYK